jgi:hypothetical protein
VSVAASLQSDGILVKPMGAGKRRLHLINVGLLKTGTTSIAGIFGRYRAAHEFMFAETTEAIYDHRRGRIDDAGLRRFVLARDVARRLEVDSAGFNYWYAAILVSAFPDARYLLVFREPAVWVESVLGQYWVEYQMAGLEETPFPTWIRQIGELMMGPFELGCFRSRERLRPALPALVQALLRHWCRAHANLLEVLPVERRLLLETARLSASLPRLAEFAGVPLAELDRSAAHLHSHETEDTLLSELDPAWLSQAIERECGAMWRQLQDLANLA